jgi:hypothetical protein
VVLFFLAFINNSSWACKLTSSSEWNFSDSDLIKKTKIVLLVKALRKDASTKQIEEKGYRFFDYDFAVEKVVKGSFNGNIYSFKDVKEWDVVQSDTANSSGRAQYGKDCRLLVNFDVGKQYLIFINAFNARGYQEVSGPSDIWLEKVKSTIQNSSSSLNSGSSESQK